MKQKTGWIPQLPDYRDLIYKLEFPVIYPDIVDLRDKMPPVYNQGKLRACTANAIASVIQFEHNKQFGQDLTPSRLFIYYNERVINGTVKYDCGAKLRDGIKSVNKQGVCPEYLWNYNPSFLKVKPSDICYSQALKDKVIEYSSINNQSLYSMKGCLASGHPFLFGFTIYESFNSKQVAKTGTVPMPSKNERAVCGHAVVAVGYDESKRVFIVRNSWGEEWGQKGYFTLPYDYVGNPGLANDFWVIKMLS